MKPDMSEGKPGKWPWERELDAHEAEAMRDLASNMKHIPLAAAIGMGVVLLAFLIAFGLWVLYVTGWRL